MNLLLASRQEGNMGARGCFKDKNRLKRNSHSFIEPLLCARHWDPAVQSTDKTHILMEKAGDNVGNEYVTYFVQMC